MFSWSTFLKKLFSFQYNIILNVVYSSILGRAFEWKEKRHFLRKGALMPLESQRFWHLKAF